MPRASPHTRGSAPRSHPVPEPQIPLHTGSPPPGPTCPSLLPQQGHKQGRSSCVYGLLREPSQLGTLIVVLGGSGFSPAPHFSHVDLNTTSPPQMEKVSTTPHRVPTVPEKGTRKQSRTLAPMRTPTHGLSPQTRPREANDGLGQAEVGGSLSQTSCWRFTSQPGRR